MRYKTACITGTLLSVLFLAGCGARTVNQILADPSRYSDKNVTIKGQVTESYSVLGRGAYQVDDGTGRIWVVSDKGVPRQGARVSVKGKVRDGFNLGSNLSLPRGLDTGLVLVESSHKAAN